MATVEVIMYPGAIAWFRSWEGPLGQGMSRLADSTKHFQQVFAPKRTGLLAASITVGPKTGTSVLSVTIGTHKGGRGYALYQDQGTRPHIIRPKRPGGYLHFDGRYAALVHHPGNPPTHWAWNGLSAAMFQEGFMF